MKLWNRKKQHKLKTAISAAALHALFLSVFLSGAFPVLAAETGQAVSGLQTIEDGRQGQIHITVEVDSPPEQANAPVDPADGGKPQTYTPADDPSSGKEDPGGGFYPSGDSTQVSGSGKSENGSGFYPSGQNHLRYINGHLVADDEYTAEGSGTSETGNGYVTENEAAAEGSGSYVTGSTSTSAYGSTVSGTGSTSGVPGKDGTPAVLAATREVASDIAAITGDGTQDTGGTYTDAEYDADGTGSSQSLTTARKTGDENIILKYALAFTGSIGCIAVLFEASRKKQGRKRPDRI